MGNNNDREKEGDSEIMEKDNESRKERGIKKSGKR